MTDIPDDVVKMALAAFESAEQDKPGYYHASSIRAAGRVFVEWEREHAKIENLFLSVFNNADTKTAESHADAFMEQNFAEAIYIQRHTNWNIIRSALVNAFKVAETRGELRSRSANE